MKRRFFCFGLLASLLPFRMKKVDSPRFRLTESQRRQVHLAMHRAYRAYGGFVVPIEFEDAIIHVPLLRGELCPLKSKIVRVDCGKGREALTRILEKM